MSRDKGAGFRNMGIPLSIRASSNSGSKIRPAAAERRERPLKSFDTRENYFSLTQCLAPWNWSNIYKESSHHSIPTFAARKIGKDEVIKTPTFSARTTRANKGLWHIGLSGVAITTLLVVNAGRGEDEPNQERTSLNTADSPTATQALPGVILDTPTNSSVEVQIPTESTIASSIGATVLRKGNEGPAVQDLQTDLLTIGCDIGKDGADGLFGPNTEQGVKTFQTNADLTPDGLFGPASQADLATALTVGNTACGLGV